MNPGLAIPIGARARRARAWLGRRWPTLFLAGVLTSFAIGPQWVLAHDLPRRLLSLAIPAQQLLLVAALAANAARYGVRSQIASRPLLAVLLLLVQSWLLADRDPGLTLGATAIAALALALPWSLPEVAVEPGMRARYALLIALLPCLCVAIGLALHAAGLHTAYTSSTYRWLRLHGASNSGWLACLALAGFAIALHEAIRTRRSGFAYLAGINAVIGVLTGGRMGVAAGVLFTIVYCLLDDRIRARLRRARRRRIGLGLAAVLLLLGWLVTQSYHEPEDSLDMSGRDTIWAGYFEQFRQSPTFGHGIGATELTTNYFKLPHNVYLRLLVEGGVTGLLLYVLALVLWGRQLSARIDPSERAFVHALWVALAVYALTDNLLTMPPVLMPFVYLGLMLGEPYACPDPGGAVPARPLPVRDGAPATGKPASAPPRSAPRSSSGR
jgi:O-antigen ligase